MRFLLAEPRRLLTGIVRWTVLAGLAGVLAGAASAAFLWALDLATDVRESHVWIIALLPVAGLVIGWAYQRFGAAVESGNNLILDEIHESRAVIPLRMTPMILLGTVITHLFGGSAGREGTAVQMGASLADRLTGWFGLRHAERRMLLMAGISGGFGAVFGTPLAGAVFGLEVLALGSLSAEALFPCLVAALVGDRVTLALGIHHTAYPLVACPTPGFATLGTAVLAGCLFGVMARGFSRANHGLAAASKRWIPVPPLRVAAGGVLVALAVWLLGTTRHIGLGIPTIEASFAGPLAWWDFAMKSLLTTITLGFGFKGGEVTPLFFIGATLGNALSQVLALPLPVLAGMGFVAVFAGAANTPLACTVMAMELFGAGIGPYAAVACVCAYLCSGHTGIYRAQRIGRSKLTQPDGDTGATLATAGIDRQNKN